MTRQGVIALLTAPLAFLALPEKAAARESANSIITFLPGRITIAPGGEITLRGDGQVKIVNCTFEGCDIAFPDQ